MKILVTGGAGYIGSHTAVALLEAGYEVVIIDNLSNSYAESITRVQKITGKTVRFIIGDVRDTELLDKIFACEKIDAVIHFAGLKAVGESVTQPRQYYDNNIGGTVSLMNAMAKANCKNIIFSSSATVYGEAEQMPISEHAPKKKSTNPYGRTKAMIEQILTDLYKSDNSYNITLLRYFNPIGAHKSGLIGEDPNGEPNNLMPYITQVAAGKLEKLKILGTDYDTADGTGVRDYIHVMDLAEGHVAALRHIKDSGLTTYNLGTGKGTSVLELVTAFEKVTGIKIPTVLKPRRQGDIATCYCNPALAERQLEWKTKYNIEEMCRDAWNWQSKNPNGFKDANNTQQQNKTKGRNKLTLTFVLTNENKQQHKNFLKLAEEFEKIYPDKIKFSSITENSETETQLADTDALYCCITETEEEKMSEQLLKTMTYAKPILCEAENSAAAKQLLNQADCGYSYPLNDINAAIGRLRILYSLMPEERTKMGQNAQKFAMGKE